MSKRLHQHNHMFDLSSGGTFSLRAWVTGHGQSALSSLGRLAQRPVASAVTTLVIAVAFSLPLALYIVLDNARRVFNPSAQLTAFLQHDLDKAQMSSVAPILRQWDTVKHVRVITQGEALAEYQQMTGFNDILGMFDGQNPLSALIVVTPHERSSNRAALIALRDRIVALDGVDSVQLDLVWVERLDAIIGALHRAVQVLFVILGLGILLIVGNTIRLGIENQREEIGIIRLFGATDAFIRRPFLYTGLWFGLAGGGLACVVAATAIWLVAGPVEDLAALYSSDFKLIGPGLRSAFTIIAAGGLLGLGGAWVAVSRELNEESAVR